MKVYLRSYKIPTILIIMGSSMCIAASLQFTVDYVSLLFWLGVGCLFLGILGWLSIQFGNYMSKRRVRAKAQENTQTIKKSPKRPGSMRRQYPF